MSESNFREIQLNTKQVVFLFMAFVVAAVAVFLLGVQAGKGMATNTSTTDAVTSDLTAKAPVPTVMPPPTTPKADDLKFHTELQGRAEARGAAPASTPPPPEPTPTPTVTPAKTSTPAPVKPTPTPTPTPVKPTPTPTPPAAKVPPPSTGAYFVQVDSFASKENAERQAKELKAKGIPAIVFTAPSGAARYKTRVGPFDRAAADAMRARLVKEGFRPSVIR
jgi:cell division septation protein DedD